jgi:hypothetical protein
MQWFMNIKFPDGYAANWSRGVNLDQLKVHGLKSHDYHIFIARLLSSMIRGFMKDDIWEALAELSYSFRVLCAKDIDPKLNLQLEANIPILLRKLNKIFPPYFFNSMEHLIVHLPYQLRVGGLVRYTWMYRVERYTFRILCSIYCVIIFSQQTNNSIICRTLKNHRQKVHNKARVDWIYVFQCPRCL